MPWHIEEDNPDCDGWAVVKDDDGSIAGCHDTKAEAEAQMRALYAQESYDPEVDGPLMIDEDVGNADWIRRAPGAVRDRRQDLAPELYDEDGNLRPPRDA